MALAIAPGIFLGVLFAALALWPGGDASAVATAGSQVHFVLQIHTKPGLANDSVFIQSQQLNSACSAGSVTYETLQGGSTAVPVTSPGSITVVLDSDGNAAVAVDAVNCASTTVTIDANVTTAPYYLATTTLKISPPAPLKRGLTVSPTKE